MFKESKHISLMISMLFVMALVLFGCSKEEQESQAVDAEAVTNEQSEHVHAAVTESGSESDAWNKICPVCGGEVSAAQETVTHAGKVYGFGCAGCPEKFAAEPEKYVNNLSADGTKFVEGD